MDLFSEFASRRENKRLGLGKRDINALKCCDRECAGFACAGLGLGDDIAFIDNRKNRFLLDMTRVFETIGVNSAEEIGGYFVDVFPLFEFGIRSGCGVSGCGVSGCGVSGGEAGTGRSEYGG